MAQHLFLGQGQGFATILVEHHPIERHGGCRVGVLGRSNVFAARLLESTRR